jgi:acyl-CoA thioesterase-1
MLDSNPRHWAVPLLAGLAVLLGALSAWSQESDREVRNILVFGDSLTAGYGVDYEQSYPNLMQGLIDKDGLSYKVIPSGVSGETSAGGLRRIAWAMRMPIDVFVLALGGNDGLRGIDLENTRSNLIQIAEKVRAKNPNVRIVIAGMQMPPNLGAHYTDAFAAVYPNVAQELNAFIIPFLLEGVGGMADLNLPDGIHPNPEGHKRVANHVYGILKPILESP